MTNLPRGVFRGHDKSGFQVYNGVMIRRVLIIFVAFAIILGGFQPSFGMMPGVAFTQVEMSASASDCPEATSDDCCDQTEKGKRLCQWNDACSARCHINVGVEPFVFGQMAALARTQRNGLPKPDPLRTTRAGPHFRPPIG